MKRKIIVAIIGLLLALAVISGCGKKNTETVNNSDDTIIDIQSEQPTEASDQADNSDSQSEDNIDEEENGQLGIEANATSLNSDLLEVSQDYIQYEEFEPKTLVTKQQMNSFIDFNYTKGEIEVFLMMDMGMDILVDAKGVYNGNEYYRIYRDPNVDSMYSYYTIIPVEAFEETKQQAPTAQLDEWGYPVIQIGSDGWPINPGPNAGGASNDADWESRKLRYELSGKTAQDLINDINDYRRSNAEYKEGLKNQWEAEDFSNMLDRENNPNYNGEVEVDHENNHRLNVN